jgi:hypothetical protein
MMPGRGAFPVTTEWVGLPGNSLRSDPEAMLGSGSGRV